MHAGAFPLVSPRLGGRGCLGHHCALAFWETRKRRMLRALCEGPPDLRPSN